MKTPYDTDRRQRRKELDDIRQALIATETQLSVFAKAIIDADAALRRERRSGRQDLHSMSARMLPRDAGR